MNIISVLLIQVQDSSKTAYKFIKTRLDEKLAKDYSIIERGGGGGSHYIMKDGEKANGLMTITAPPMRPSRVSNAQGHLKVKKKPLSCYLAEGRSSYSPKNASLHLPTRLYDPVGRFLFSPIKFTRYI